MAPRQARLIEDAPAQIEPVTETITYIPGEGDPATITWCGHKFHANVPKDITGHAEGSATEKLNWHLIERARENPVFKVGTNPVKREPVSGPSTSADYIRYCFEWLKNPEIEHAEQLIARFAKDRDLRLSCEVGSDDYATISTILMPRLHQLAKIDELNDSGLARLWIAHGFNELPW